MTTSAGDNAPRLAVAAEKRRLRARVLAAREAMPAALRATATTAITATLLGLPHYRAARCVAAYSAIGAEFDTAALLRDALAAGKKLLLPRVNRGAGTLSFYQVADPGAQLLPGTWNILEPDPARCALADPSGADFMLVPGVAFTADCQRLGYGGGYYDAVMAALAPSVLRVAAAFSVQIVDRLPMEAWDRPVDAVVTESARFGAVG